MRSTKRKYESESDDEDNKPEKRPNDGSRAQGDEDSAGDNDCESDGDSDEGHDDVYNASSESLPAQAAFDPLLKRACDTASKTIDEILAVLKSHASKSATLRNMQKNAQEMLAPPQPEPPMIAFVGPTGEGKSSAGNAVLAVKGIMQTGSAGESVTNVATIYQWSFPNQMQRYAARISYRALEDCRDILENLLICHTQGFLELGVEEECTKEQCEYEMHAQEALKTFVSLFGNKEGFRSLAETKATLEKQSGPEEAALVDQMLCWCKAHFATLQQINDVSTAYFEAEDIAELERLIRPYTTDTTENEAISWWPLVQEVRIGTSESHLLEYVRVVDLPGQSDTNPIRARTAEETIRRCHGIWIFADIKRALTDPDLSRTVTLYAHRFPDTLAVVLTKTDMGVNHALLQAMRTHGEDLGEHDRLAKEIPCLKSELTNLNKRLSKKGKLSQEQYIEMSQQAWDIKEQINGSTNKVFSELVLARNNRTKRLLQQSKQQHVPPGKLLRVFAISPEHYEMHTASGPRAAPLMDVSVTGLPVLRHHALLMAGPPLWRARKEYLESQVSVFIHGLKLWSTGPCAAAHRRQLLDIVGDMRDAANKGFDQVLQRRYDLIKSTVIRPLEANRHKACEDARTELAMLELWRGPSFVAFYRRGGQHTTATKGTVSWNEIFLESQTKDVLEPGWHKMTLELQATFSEAKKNVSDAIEIGMKSLMLSAAAVRLDKVIIEGLFTGILSGAESDYERITEAFSSAILATKLDATKDRSESFFTKAMGPAYLVGRSERGSGVAKRCKNHMREHLSRPIGHMQKPFKVYYMKLSQALRSDNKHHTLNLQEAIVKRTTEVYERFETITKQNPESSAERAARKAIAPLLEHALGKMKQIQGVFQELQKKYPEC